MLAVVHRESVINAAPMIVLVKSFKYFCVMLLPPYCVPTVSYCPYCGEKSQALLVY